MPVVKKETEGRKGKTDGQPAHTREVKLGCVFTQTAWDKEGYAIRDPDSTTYTGAIETAEEFGKRIYLEAWNRGWSRAAKKVVMGDGAEWIWNLADQHFPGAVQIVDLYHARQHLWDLARKLYPNDTVSQKAWIKVHQKRLLDKGKIEKLVLSLRSTESTNADVLDKIRTEADYFERNAERMRYPKFRRQHLFVGSGVIEAGCKTVIGSRLKQSGMFWTVRGANSIIALRCCHLNGRFEDYWESRCGNSARRWCAVRPFSHCINRLIVTCGGSEINRCTWSFDTCPFMIDTSCWPQMSRIRSRTRVATSPCNAGLRYFVIHTRCKWISNTVCAPRRYSAIPEVYPARTR